MAPMPHTSAHRTLATVPEAARILQVGPDPRAEGGMPAVVRDLMASPLAARYPMEAVPTYVWQDMPATVRRFAWALVRLARRCRQPGPRLAHVHSAVRGSLYRKSVCVVWVRALGRPVILHVHAGAVDIDAFVAGLGPVRRRAFAWAMARATRVLSVSRAGAERLAEHFGRRDVLVVPNAAPAVVAPPPGPLPAGLLYLGGFEDPAKGGADLVAVLAAVAAAAPGAPIVLAGPGEPARVERGRIEEAGAHWAGWLDAEAKRRAFAAAGVVAFPSISEGLPVTLLEAMANGRAIVATRVGGMPEVLTDGADARLVAPGDAPALVAAIVALLGDGRERDRLGAAARRRAERLNADEVSGRLEALYAELLDPMA
jgi:glycosyltransferase involved in cell wall biosynthesis